MGLRHGAEEGAKENSQTGKQTPQDWEKGPQDRGADRGCHAMISNSLNNVPVILADNNYLTGNNDDQ
ncbi:MAG: hypothetical protein AAF603_10135, partial [Pseudomonadota bacterium]